MNLVKKLAISAATVSLAATAFMSPVFADADASNDHISDHSHARSKAEDNDTYRTRVRNSRTIVVNANVGIANTGGNTQRTRNGDDNKLTTGKADVWGKNNADVNTTVITY